MSSFVLQFRQSDNNKKEYYMLIIISIISLIRIKDKNWKKDLKYFSKYEIY